METLVDNVKINISLKQHRSAGSGISAYPGPDNKKSIAKQIFAGAFCVVILVAGYFGVPKVMELLHSNKEAAPAAIVVTPVAEEAKKEAELNKIPEYASLAGVNRADITAMVEWLIENHFILQTKGKYPLLNQRLTVTIG